MSLVQHQFPALHWTQKKKVAKMALFVVFVYLEAWFSATVLVSAASNDLAFHKRADSFKAVDKKVSRSATKVLNRHTWYLTEELIALTIFDEGLTKETRDLIAAKLGNLDVEKFEIKKPSLPTITAATAVSDFAQGLSSTSSKYPRTFCGKRTGRCSQSTAQRNESWRLSRLSTTLRRELLPWQQTITLRSQGTRSPTRNSCW